jgi:hypothetical protein
VLHADRRSSFGWWWADPLTALAIAAVAVKEGRESRRGEGCAEGLLSTTV